MNIGLVGYFGWGNYGDELFIDVYKKYFSEHNLVFFHDPINNKLLDNLDDLIDSVDAIIIGGGDLIIPWSLSWLYWDKRFLKKPVFIYGVGVPNWGGEDPSVMEHYKYFINHPNVKMLSCRDIESSEWVKEHIGYKGDIPHYPDMILAKTFPQQKKTGSVGFILRKQEQYKTEQLYKLANLVGDMGYDLKLILLGTGRTLNDDYEVFNNIRFKNYQVIIRDSISKLSDEISQCDYIVSMKFHGIIASYKSSVDFISLSGAGKFTSFMKESENEYYSSNWADAGLTQRFETLVYQGTNFSKQEALTNSAISGLLALKNEINSF